MECRHCGGRCVKKGLCRDGRQKYRCRSCGKYQRESYKKRAWLAETNDWILRLNGEGCGIANICRLLGIAKGTVLRRMRRMWNQIGLFPVVVPGSVVEVDELCTHVGRRSNKIYVCSAVCRETGKVLAFGVGKRRKEMIGPVIGVARSLSPKMICTDGLNLYPGLLRGSAAQGWATSHPCGGKPAPGAADGFEAFAAAFGMFQQEC